MKRSVIDEQEYATERLREMLPVGSTVYTVLRHVSRSGMFRVISCYIVSFREPDYRYPEGKHKIVRIDALVTDAVQGLTYSVKHDGVSMSGAGMDMGFALVYDLAWTLHGDGYALNHSWL